jgi:hypothetical protein
MTSAALYWGAIVSRLSQKNSVAAPIVAMLNENALYTSSYWPKVIDSIYVSSVDTVTSFFVFLFVMTARLKITDITAAQRLLATQPCGACRPAGRHLVFQAETGNEKAAPPHFG